MAWRLSRKVGLLRRKVEQRDSELKLAWQHVHKLTRHLGHAVQTIQDLREEFATIKSHLIDRDGWAPEPGKTDAENIAALIDFLAEANANLIHQLAEARPTPDCPPSMLERGPVNGE